MNPFYSSHQEKQQMPPQGFDLNGALQNILNQIRPTGMTAEQIVRSNIQNGTWQPEKFRQYANIANRLTGMNR
ncbi:MAG: hypothetical protein IJ005_01795 [Bacteroidales bacterium]|nr:hypothetical protein [Bacteroidales bacterium]